MAETNNTKRSPMSMHVPKLEKQIRLTFANLIFASLR